MPDSNTFLDHINDLCHHHQENCSEYAALLTAYGLMPPFSSLKDIPPVSVRLFKEMRLSSVPKEDVFKVLTSSGTSGQAVSQIVLDRETAVSQTRALASIMQERIGKSRLPMLILDTVSVIKDPAQFSARGAGIVGFSTFGIDHTYVLDESMQINWEALKSFAERHKGKSILLFGFTYMVFQYVVKELEKRVASLDIESGYLIHGGGWKKLVSESVSNAEFDERVHHTLGSVDVINYYGMVEQVGSIYMGCSEGFFHCPEFSDVIVRDPISLAPVPHGTEGVIQVCSTLPKSYPGHLILTEDVGTIHGKDTCKCGREGTYFSVAGRLQKAEKRGCSDTYES